LWVESFTENELTLFHDKFPFEDYKLSFKAREDSIENGWSDVDWVIAFLKEFKDPSWVQLHSVEIVA